jgi:chromate reductase, NAD(P)H dehydrogenase (quinone)
MTIRILAISGSLREASSNTTLLRAAIALAPSSVEMKLYEGLNDLPHFNPDLEPIAPASVKDLIDQIKWCDGLVISTPEYAHGIPGVLKNALDWLVSSEDFMGKPIALFNASSRSTYAQASLIEIVTTMAGRIIPEANVTIALLGSQRSCAEIVADPKLSGDLRGAINTFIDRIKEMRG